MYRSAAPGRSAVRVKRHGPSPYESNFLRRHDPDQVKGPRAALRADLSRTCARHPWDLELFCGYTLFYPAPFPLSRRGTHPAQLGQHGLEPVGQRALHRDALPGAGVDEGEPPGVEALARQTGIGTLAPVHRVPGRGWPMDAMCTRIWWVRRSPDGTGCRRIRSAAPARSVGDSLPPLRVHRHALAVGAVPGNGGVHGALVLRRLPTQMASYSR